MGTGHLAGRLRGSGERCEDARDALPGAYRALTRQPAAAAACAPGLMGSGILAYTLRPMPNRTERQSTSRAEARRRARYAAQGRDEDEDMRDTEEPEGARPASATWLERLIPPAPPLPGKGDPLAGFTYAGSGRRAVVYGYLLLHNLPAWLLPGLVWLLVSLVPPSDNILALVSSIVAYIALIGAGWIGWQRPWFYGVAAALIGWLPIVAYTFASYSANPSTFAATDGTVPTFSQMLSVLLVRTALQVVLGAVAGFYGGYLRRRLADQRPPAQRGKNGRRR
jgi:hypothetical protein